MYLILILCVLVFRLDDVYFNTNVSHFLWFIHFDTIFRRIIHYEFGWIEINCGFLAHKNDPLWCHLPMVLASWARLLLLNKSISSLYLSIFKRHFKLSLILLANLISLEKHNYKVCVPLWKEKGVGAQYGHLCLVVFEIGIHLVWYMINLIR